MYNDRMVLFVLCTRRAKWQVAKGCRQYRASLVMQGVSKCAQVGNGNRMCACNAHSVKYVASDVGRVCVVLLRHRRGVLSLLWYCKAGRRYGAKLVFVQKITVKQQGCFMYLCWTV